MQHVHIRILLYDHQGEAIGHQDHGVPESELAPYQSSPEALAAFMRDTLLPQAAQVTLDAYLAALPEHERDPALASIHKAVLVLDPEGEQPLQWVAEIDRG